MYNIDPTQGDLIISGFQNGIGDDPYSGLTDLRNVNIISTPGEASVNFATSKVSPSQLTGAIVSASSSVITFTGGAGLSTQMGILVSGSTLAGVTSGQLYLAKVSGATMTLWTNYALTNQVVISGTGTGTFTSLTVGDNGSFTGIKHYTRDSLGYYWGIDSKGYVWSNRFLDANGNWTPSGNLPNTYSAGNGLVFYQGTSTNGYLFAFSNGSIDVCEMVSPYTWKYQWDWMNGGYLNSGNWGATPSSFTLKATNSEYSHQAIVPPDGHVYFCDWNWIGQFFQTSPSTPFDPATFATYTPSQTQLLPYNDRAQCLSFLGTNLMVGGILNAIYPWDRVSTQFNFPILLGENTVWKMVTVNTNTFCFVGNRGRIYVSNGTNANLWKKVPDYVSGTVEPYFQFYDACYQKNQLYFSFSQHANPSFASLATVGGVWAVDLDTKALRMVNKLSYGTYAGYATALIAITPLGTGNPPASGAGLYIGWYDGVSTYGIDSTVSTVYTNGEATVTSDLIPIGTLLQPSTPQQVEFKLSTPLLTGEKVELQTAAYLGGPFTSQLITSGDGALISGNSQSMNVQQQQWLLVKAILTGVTGANVSYNRLMQIRVKGATVSDKVASAPYGLQ
jgi:hypothetical protein